MNFSVNSTNTSTNYNTLSESYFSESQINAKSVDELNWYLRIEKLTQFKKIKLRIKNLFNTTSLQIGHT
jgi:hypothetical protein